MSHRIIGSPLVLKLLVELTLNNEQRRLVLTSSDKGNCRTALLDDVGLLVEVFKRLDEELLHVVSTLAQSYEPLSMASLVVLEFKLSSVREDLLVVDYVGSHDLLHVTVDGDDDALLAVQEGLDLLIQTEAQVKSLFLSALLPHLE